MRTSRNTEHRLGSVKMQNLAEAVLGAPKTFASSAAFACGNYFSKCSRKNWIVLKN